MATVKDKKSVDFRVEIGTPEPRQWNDADIGRLKASAKQNAKLRTDEQKLKNELMALRFEIEEYLHDRRSKPLTIEQVVVSYLNILNLNFRKFAFCIDTTDSNLKKYLSGERKFNTDLALKFSYFFHTPAELWLQLQLKNELLELKKEKKQIKQYQKYDYRKVLGIAK